MKKLHILAAASLSLACVGCNDFLDRTPYTEVSSSAAFSSPTMAETVVTGAYANLRAEYGNVNGINFDALASVLDPRDNTLADSYAYLLGTAQPSAGMFSNRWKRLYEGINRANDVINHIGSVPGMDEALKARRAAECKFLRAYNYYQLNALWRGVPIYLENLSDAEYTRPRSTEQEVWEQCVADLSDCIDCESIPDRLAASSSDWGRATRAAALALRAKVYMWQRMWDKAEADLRRVGELGHSLFRGPYAELFTLDNEHCDEMIFSITMTELSGLGSVMPDIYGNRCTAGYGHGQYFVSPGFVDSFEWADGRPFDWDEVIPGYSELSPGARRVYFLRDNITSEESLIAQNAGADLSKYLPSGNEARVEAAYAGRDPRLAAIAITPGADYVGGATGSPLTYRLRYPYRSVNAPSFDILTDQPSAYRYPVRKFVPVGVTIKNTTYSPIDVPVLRYAGVLIDLAECINEQGRVAEAATVLNAVRRRAGVAELNAPGNLHTAVAGADDMRQRIYKERRWELAGECVLYYDELRQGTWKEAKFAPGNGMTEIWGECSRPYRWGGEGYDVWPVPRVELEKNPNLTQNPGWY